MFITHQSAKSPFSELLGGTSHGHWNEVELALELPWFVVALRQAESDAHGVIEIPRTILLSSVQEVEKIALQTVDGPTKLVAIHIVTPGHFNGSEAWKMDQLRAVWKAVDPKEPGRIVDVYETRDGEKYSSSPQGTGVDALTIGSFRFRAPPDHESKAAISLPIVEN